ncbi:MAG TPA: class II aldolase/adducin family protein, partial [Thermoanaerobaculia bacterium]|nr:class II aldolase/adducin family protein [Thermoanaerobaculia bacterium]
LHLEVIAARPVRSVLHTHSTWSTLVSDRFAPRGGVAIQGYEMLKGLAGVTTHEYREWIPIVENDQDMPRLAAKIGETLHAHPECHAFLLRRHGLYTWGATLPEAVRHVEIVEFLLESVGRKEAASWRS